MYETPPGKWLLEGGRNIYSEEILLNEDQMIEYVLGRRQARTRTFISMSIRWAGTFVAFGALTLGVIHLIVWFLTWAIVLWGTS